MGDFFMRTRVEIVRRNLERIVQLESTVKSRTIELSALIDDLASANTAKRSSWDLFFERRGDWKNEVPTSSQLRELFIDLERSRDAVDEAVGQAKARAERMREAFLELPGNRQDVRDLVERARELRANVDVNRYAADSAGCEALFADYVEILRGVALREAGLAEEGYTLADLLRLAEALPDMWGRRRGRSWLSVVVPGLAEGSRSSVALLLRMGFPEWTYWALPLVLHDFAHVWFEWGRLTPVQSDELRAAALADAAATLMTGPAYAAAALVLRLNPASVRADDSVDAVRAAAILRTLQRVLSDAATPELKAPASPDGPLAKLIARLRQEWVDAVRAAGGDGEAMDKLIDSDLIGELTEEAAEGVPAMARPGLDQPQWAVNWATVSIWATTLRSGRVLPSDGIGSASAEGLAMMMDAAWLCRFSVDPTNDVHEPAALDRIAGEAMTWSLRLLDALLGRNASRPAGDSRGLNVPRI